MVAGVDVNIQNSVGDTALILATVKAQKNCLEILLKFGANVNIQGKNGFTALMHAALDGNIICLGMLLNSGADPNTVSDNDISSCYRTLCPGKQHSNYICCS